MLLQIPHLKPTYPVQCIHTLHLPRLLHKPRRRECLHWARSLRRVPLQQAFNKLHRIRAGNGRVHGNRGSALKEVIIHVVREPVSARPAERMGAREDLMQDDTERPHIDSGSVRVVVGAATSHLRRDVRERADLRVKAVLFGGPFGVVEVAELDPDRKDGGNEDVLRVLA